jgi:predicted PurR-regulated permease PerM
VIALALKLTALAILGVALVTAAFGTLGLVAAIPVAAALIVGIAQGARHEPRPTPPPPEPESVWQPRPGKRDPASPD